MLLWVLNGSDGVSTCGTEPRCSHLDLLCAGPAHICMTTRAEFNCPWPVHTDDAEAFIFQLIVKPSAPPQPPTRSLLPSCLLHNNRGGLRASCSHCLHKFLASQHLTFHLQYIVQSLHKHRKHDCAKDFMHALSCVSNPNWGAQMTVCGHPIAPVHSTL